MDNVKNNQKLKENIKYFIEIYPDLENLSKIKGEKAEDFIKLLNELKNAEFIVEKKQKMGIYELKSVKSNRNENI